MNNPEYILTDVFADIAENIRVELGLTNINYQYCYRDELNETLEQWAKTPTFLVKKFPIVWLSPNIKIKRGISGWYGVIERGDILLIEQTDKNWKTEQRIENVFKPKLLPMYRELVRQIGINKAFTVDGTFSHSYQFHYFWSATDEKKRSAINDIVDCIEINFSDLKVNNNKNCP